MTQKNKYSWEYEKDEDYFYLLLLHFSYPYLYNEQPYYQDTQDNQAFYPTMAFPG